MKWREKYYLNLIRININHHIKREKHIKWSIFEIAKRSASLNCISSHITSQHTHKHGQNSYSQWNAHVSSTISNNSA